jgi:hypothetical protein
VDSHVVVNPSYLTRSQQGGTFAKLAIHPAKELETKSMEVDGETMDHRVYERARVDIVRI